MNAGTPKWQAIAAGVVIAAAIAVMAWTFDAEDPIRQWLVWRYAGLMALALGWAFCCLTGGFAIARRLGLRALPPRELLVQSFALGVLAFTLLTVALGLLHAIGTASFVAVPLVLLASGALSFPRYLWRYVRRLRRLQLRLSMLSGVAAFYGVACCVAIYLTILSPANLSYDARWYHLPIAEHYAATGAIVRFDEGWFLGALPHLASWLFTWAFTMPGTLFGRIELVMHLEFILFLATALAVPVLVSRLLKRPRLGGAFAALFLFPGIFVYDSGLGGGADHVLAFWAVPLFLALFRFWGSPTSGRGLLLGALIGAAALTKYQAVSLVLVPLGALAFSSRRAPRATVIAVVALLVVTAPHWLLNLVWHHNPVYPFAFGGDPMLGTTVNNPAFGDGGFFPVGTLFERIKQTVVGVVTFGFVAHDWETFHGHRPVFGSLFLPALVLLPFVKARRAMWVLGAAGVLGAAAWFWTYHQDRYLQALAPVLAVFVVVVLATAWRKVALLRPLIVAIVALQLVACADLYFLPTHVMANGSAISKAIELITSGHRHAYAERDQTGSPYAGLQGLLPADAKVLVHEVHLHLGLGRAAVRDAPNRQGGIAYSAWRDTAGVVRELRKLGVTHVIWRAGPNGWNTIADDLVFVRFTQQALKAQPLPDGSLLGKLPTELAPVKGAGTIAMLSCAAERIDPAQLDGQVDRIRNTQCAAPASAADVSQMLTQADVAVLDTRRFPTAPPELSAFALMFTRAEFQVWGRSVPLP